MSIFSKAGAAIMGPIVKQVIRKEIKKNMEQWKPIWVIIQSAIEKFGTKFVLALGVEGWLGYLIYDGKIGNPLFGVIGMVITALGYFAARRAQETEQITAATTAQPVTDAKEPA